MSEPVSPYPFQHLWLYVLLILDILWVWNDNHIEVLIHISLITSAIELFFICFCKHFQKRYSNLLPIFKLGCLIFWVVGVLHIFWILNPYLKSDFQIFSPIEYIFFSLLSQSPLMHKWFSFWGTLIYLNFLLLLILWL